MCKMCIYCNDPRYRTIVMHKGPNIPSSRECKRLCGSKELTFVGINNLRVQVFSGKNTAAYPCCKQSSLFLVCRSFPSSRSNVDRIDTDTVTLYYNNRTT